MQPNRHEVMVRATIPANRVRQGVWYLESDHEDPAAARLRFRQVVAEHRDPRLMVVLVESRYDEAQGLFMDRILDSRSEAPLPALRDSVALPDDARLAMRKAFARAPASVPPLRMRPRRPAPQPRRTVMPWVAMAAVAGIACIAAVALRGF